MIAHIQFIKGIDEKILPDIRLTRSRDGSTGTATFRFKNANVLDKSLALNGEITAIYIMKSPEGWDRFMRFMKRYGESNGLVFTKA